MKIVLILPVFTVLLSGCAAMSVEQCKTANWFNVGEKDGSAGQESRLDRYYSSCQKASVVPNQSLYEKGYQQGLGYYCRPETMRNIKPYIAKLPKRCMVQFLAYQHKVVLTV